MASRFDSASPYGHGYTGCRTDIATGTTNGGRSSLTSPPKTSPGVMLVSGALERYDGAWAEGAVHINALRMGVRAAD